MRTVVLLVVLLLGLSACGAKVDHELKIFTDQERSQVEKLNETNTQAVMANGYRAVGTYDRREEESGTSARILFAKCSPDQKWEECVRATPTTEEPHFFITGWWRDGNVKVGAFGAWRFRVGTSTPLDCNTMAPMNAYTVKQVPIALKHFIDRRNRPINGLKEIDFPENPDPNGPSGMGNRVQWHCHWP